MPPPATAGGCRSGCSRSSAGTPGRATSIAEPAQIDAPPAAGERRTRIVAIAILVAVSFPLWYGGMRLRGGRGMLDHSPIDQHTRQARAWLQGRVDLPAAPGYLEIAEKDGRFYNSFPPTPGVFEVPLVLVFGRDTPSSLVVYLFWVAALAAQFHVLRARGFPPRDALLASLAFVFGTNVYVSCVRANVWAYGQSLGYCLAILGIAFVAHNTRRGPAGPTAGYVLLALAVGCRPLYLSMVPLFLALDHRTSGRSVRRAVVTGASAMAPIGIVLAWYNWARFGDPAEFGHNYLPWAKKLETGIFDVAYLPRNLYHAFVRWPEWTGGAPPLSFDPWGTAFYINQGILLFVLWGLLARRFDPVVKATAGFAMAVIAAGIFTYEAGGWRQFGYRYIIDVIPAGFVVFAFAYERFNRWMLAAFAWSLAVNVYGVTTWKDLPRPR